MANSSDEDDDDDVSNLSTEEPISVEFLMNKLRSISLDSNLSLPEIRLIASEIEAEFELALQKVIPDPKASYSNVAAKEALDCIEKDLRLGRLETDFEILGAHGRGGFGSVFACRHKLDKQLYAIKRIPFEEDAKIPMELFAMARLQHPYIVRYYQAWTEPYKMSNHTPPPDDFDDDSDDESATTECLYIQMECCPMKFDGLDIKNGWTVFLQILEGLYHMHMKNICHCDISNQNILLDIEGNGRIIDLGLARFLNEEIEDVDTRELVKVEPLEFLGNLPYRAPEILKQDPAISAKVDIYSLGMLIVDIFNPCDTYQEKFQLLTRLKSSRKLPKFFKDEDGDIKKALLDMTNSDPDRRPSAANLLSALESKR